MTDKPESLESAASQNEEPDSPVAKKGARKAAKKSAKKAAKKATKKAAKKVSPKTAKKAVKATRKKAVDSPELELDLGLDAGEGGGQDPNDNDAAMIELAAAEAAAAKAAKEAAEAAEKARKAAVKAREAKEKETSRKKAEREEQADSVETDPKTDDSARDAKDGPDRKRQSRKGAGKDPEDDESSADREKRAPAKKEEKPPPPPPEVPDEIDLNEFREVPLSDFYEELERLPVRIPNRATRAELVFTVLSCYATHGTRIVGTGILELGSGSFGMIRDETRSFRNGADDLHVPAALIEEHGLREGQRLKVVIGEPRHRDKFLSVSSILEVEGVPLADYTAPAHFDQLTSLFPEDRFVLEGADERSGLATRVVDLVAPLGRGQRGLIVAPPREEKQFCSNKSPNQFR